MNNLHRHTPGLDAFRYGFAFSAVKWGRRGQIFGMDKGIGNREGTGVFFPFFLMVCAFPHSTDRGSPPSPNE